MFLDPVPDTALKVLFGASRDGSESGHKGSASCLQLFNSALTPQHLHFQKDCHGIKEERTGRCPEKYHYYEGQCYTVSYKRQVIHRVIVRLCTYSNGVSAAKYRRRLRRQVYHAFSAPDPPWPREFGHSAP